MLEESAFDLDADDRAYMSLNCHYSLNYMDRNYYFDYKNRVDDSCCYFRCYKNCSRRVNGRGNLRTVAAVDVAAVVVDLLSFLVFLAAIVVALSQCYSVTRPDSVLAMLFVVRLNYFASQLMTNRRAVP